MEGIKCYFWVFDMTWSGFNPKSAEPKPQNNALGMTCIQFCGSSSGVCGSFLFIGWIVDNSLGLIWVLCLMAFKPSWVT